MIDRLNIIVSRYNEIQEELLKPEILGDYSKMKTLSKEKSDLEEIVKKYDEYKETQKRIDDAKALINDPEMHDLAEMELDEATESLKTITHELEILLIPKDEMMERISSWKFVELLEETKLIYLPEIYLECILDMLKNKDGKLK